MKIEIPLVGVLQAWGAPSEFTYKRCYAHPTKRGVIGLIACCMGITRDQQDRIEELSNQIDFKWRYIDDAKDKIRILSDYQIASKPDGSRLNAADGKKCDSTTIVMHKEYVLNGAFIATLEGSTEIMKNVYDALMDPYWPPYLGRKNCPPSVPIIPKIVEE